MRASPKAILLNSSLAVVSLLLAWLAAEWIFLHQYTRLFPIDTISRKFENYQGVYPLLQSAKKGFYPHNYIAVTGDSYAAGLGDDILQGGNRNNPRGHSIHFLQDLSGKDVISYGMPGSGSVRGMITNTQAAETYIRRLINPGLEAPQWLLIYFYEGNDLTENWIYYQKTFLPYHPDMDYSNPDHFDQYIQDTALGRDHLYLSATRARFQDRWFLYRYLQRLYIENVQGRKFFTRRYKDELKLEYEPEYKWVNRFSKNPVNQAVINGQVVALADNMQGPSMDLTQAQLEHGVMTFAHSLRYIQQQYPHTRLALVYIPSVLTTYETRGSQVHVQNFFSDDKQLFSRQALDQRAMWIRQMIRERSLAQGIPFIDTTADLQSAAHQALLHGPKDLNHLNRKGYQTLAESIYRQLPTESNHP